MKKRIALLLAGVLAVGCLTACGGGNNAAKVKVGLGAHVQMDYSTKDANPEAEEGKQDGTAQADLHVAAVTVDADGKIVAVEVDSIQMKATFNTKGEVVLGTEQKFQTKKELGDNYNMKKYGPQPPAAIGKEWYEQADAFMKFVNGMTADQVKAIATDDSGYVTDETLKAGCTMKISAYQAAVAKALAK